MNWKLKVAEINKRKFSAPEGWDDAKKVASQLQCDPDKVPKLLKPGIDCGEIERKSFPVWNDERRMVVPQTFYRQISEDAPKKSDKKSGGTSLRESILASLMANPARSNAKIADSFRLRGATAQMVAEIRKEYSV